MRSCEPISILIIAAMLLTGIGAFLPAADAELTSSDPLLASTYLESAGYDYGNCITTDSQGNIIIAGRTNSSGFPIFPNPGAYSTVHHNPGSLNWGEFSETFVLKMDPTGTELIFSTFLGGSGNDMANGIAVDSNDNIYITGFTDSTDFPVTSQFVTVRGWGEAFVCKMDPTGSSLLYSVILGGSEWEEGKDIAVDSSGNAYVFGETNSPDFYSTASTKTYQRHLFRQDGHVHREDRSAGDDHCRSSPTWAQMRRNKRAGSPWTMPETRMSRETPIPLVSRRRTHMTAPTTASFWWAMSRTPNRSTSRISS